MLHGHLAVLGGIADILRGWALDVGESFTEGLDDVPGLVQAQGSLGEICDSVGVRYGQCCDFCRIAYHLSYQGRFTQSANHLVRSEEHTSELQSRGHLVCRLLLEKKKQA